VTLGVLTLSVPARIFNPSGSGCWSIASFPDPAQLFVTCCMEKLREPGIFSQVSMTQYCSHCQNYIHFTRYAALHRFAITFNNISSHDRNSIITCDIYGSQLPRCCAAQKGLLRRLVNLVTALNTILRLNYSHSFASAISTIACGWAVLTVLSKFSVRY